MLLWIAYLGSILIKPVTILAFLAMLVCLAKKNKLNKKLKSKNVCYRDLTSCPLPRLRYRLSVMAVVTLLLGYCSFVLQLYVAASISYVSCYTAAYLILVAIGMYAAFLFGIRQR